jgi:hypothetical protein
VKIGPVHAFELPRGQGQSDRQRGVRRRSRVRKLLLALTAHAAAFAACAASAACALRRFTLGSADAAVAIAVHTGVALQHGGDEFFAGHSSIAIAVEHLHHAATAALTTTSTYAATHAAAIICIQATVIVTVHSPEHLRGSGFGLSATDGAVAIGVRVGPLHAAGPWLSVGGGTGEHHGPG